MREGKAVKIRLNGIDCPEKGQDFGTKAKSFTSDACFGKPVTVKVFDTDRYGRLVGDIVLPDGRILNQELVRAGLAWHYKAYSKDETLARLENEARAAMRGLWSIPNPTPPWDFRHPPASKDGKSSGPDNAISPAAKAKAPAIQSLTPDSPGPAADGSVTVYITRTGKDYHRDGCAYLSSSKTPISLTEAKARGYTPCSKCKPPQ